MSKGRGLPVCTRAVLIFCMCLADYTATDSAHNQDSHDVDMSTPSLSDLSECSSDSKDDDYVLCPDPADIHDKSSISICSLDVDSTSFHRDRYAVAEHLPFASTGYIAKQDTRERKSVRNPKDVDEAMEMGFEVRKHQDTYVLHFVSA